MQISKFCPVHLRQHSDLEFSVLGYMIQESTKVRACDSTGQKQIKVHLMLLNKINISGHNR